MYDWGKLGSVLPEPETPVVVVNRSADSWTNAFFVKPHHISARKPAGTTGWYIGWVPGGGGDLWWVRHSDGSVAAYCYTEMGPPSC